MRMWFPIKINSAATCLARVKTGKRRSKLWSCVSLRGERRRENIENRSKDWHVVNISCVIQIYQRCLAVVVLSLSRRCLSRRFWSASGKLSWVELTNALKVKRSFFSGTHNEMCHRKFQIPLAMRAICIETPNTALMSFFLSFLSLLCAYKFCNKRIPMITLLLYLAMMRQLLRLELANRGSVCDNGIQPN